MELMTPPGRVVGALPLFRQLAQDIGLVEAINQTVRWDARQCHLSPGERLLVLVLDILGGKSPLYRMVEGVAVQEKLAGPKEIQTDQSPESGTKTPDID